MPRPRNVTPNVKMVSRGSRFYARWWENGAWQRKSLNTDQRALAEDRFRDMVGTLPAPAVALAAWDRSRRPSHRGLISETKVILRLLELGGEVYVAWGHDHRADLIVVSGTNVARVQVKSARASAGKLLVQAYSVASGKASQPYNRQECEAIVAYSPAKDDCFVVQVVDGRTRYVMDEASRLRDLRQVFGVVLPGGIEPPAPSLPRTCSTTELRQPHDTQPKQPLAPETDPGNPRPNSL